MEKGNSFMNGGGYGIGFQENGLNNSSSDQLQNMFYNNPTWENSMDQNDPFGSALSSMVSSPTTTPNVVVPGNDNFVLREFIGRLGGGISNSGEISTNTSCYNTPLNSPPKLKLSMMDHQIRENLHFHGGNGNHLPTHPSLAQFSSDPGFADRAARFSTVSNSQSMKVSGSQLGVQELKHVSSLHHGNPATDQKFNGIARSLTPENYEIGNSRENSSVSEQISLGEIGKNGQKDANSRKRKAVPKGKAKETTAKDTNNVAPENNESHVKRSKSDENNGSDKANGTEKAAGDGNQKQNKDNQKPPEAPKDYIHVRARSGQATDAHSLAERVRREKIGERMKLLQDLVPGCNKVTGKAVMLDEIINYVQSLQRQVEFLSMKLSTVNPRMDFNMESLLSKDIFQSRSSLHQNIHPSEASAQAFPYGFQSQSGQNLPSALPKGSDVLFSINPFNPNMARNVPTFFEDDLNGVVQMGFNQI